MEFYVYFVVLYYTILTEFDLGSYVFKVYGKALNTSVDLVRILVVIFCQFSQFCDFRGRFKAWFYSYWGGMARFLSVQTKFMN